MRITLGMLLVVLASVPLGAQVATVDAVRLRAAPSAAAAAARTLDIATPLVVEASAAPGWVRVRAADGARGWVRRELTTPYDAANPLPALRRITERSLARESAPFATRARLVNVLSGASGATPAARAELAFLRLRALQKALDEHAAKGAGPAADPLRDGGIRADSSEVAYGEPQGQWYVRADRFWELHDRNRGLGIAESIAWHAATQQLPGECEGDATCLFGLAEITMGQYLSRHPRGAHAPAALRELARLLAYVDEQSREYPFCTRTGANYTLKPAQIAALGRIVDASAGAERGRVSKLVQTLARRCT